MRDVPTTRDSGTVWLGHRSGSWQGPRVASRRSFHAALPGYGATPLRAVADLAADLGVGTVLVKDESLRFDLPSFKILGASWGVYQALCARMGEAVPEWTTMQELREHLAPLRDVCLLSATAGNHGRAVARVARWLDLHCLVLVPSTLDAQAVDRIRGEGVQVRVVQGSYDDAVVQARDLADSDDRYLMVQDTAWPGYERIPAWIVEGYDTLFEEIDDEIGSGDAQLGLVVVPAGVGSLLAAAIRHYHAPGRASVPAVASVEPTTAACVLDSVRADRPIAVRTDGPTVMAGLNAGTVSSAAWPVIRAGLDMAVAVDDDAALRAQDRLHRAGIHAGPCGSAALAGATTALAGDQRHEVRGALGLSEGSTVVLISTDGRG